MEHQSELSKPLAKMPRVRLDETLMTIMLLNEQPIIAVATERPRDGEPGHYCHVVRMDEHWSEA